MSEENNEAIAEKLAKGEELSDEEWQALGTVEVEEEE